MIRCAELLKPVIDRLKQHQIDSKTTQERETLWPLQNVGAIRIQCDNYIAEFYDERLILNKTSKNTIANDNH